MKYYLINGMNSITQWFDSWWDLVDHFYNPSYKTTGLYYYTDDIRHNDNDYFFKDERKSYYDEEQERHVYYTETCCHLKAIYVYNEFGVIINKHDINFSLKNYKPRKTVKKYHSWRKVIFEYRNGPVPGIHKFGNGSYFRSKIRRNKNHAASLLEYIELNHKNSRIMERVLTVKSWSDEFPPTTKERSWKSQSKKRKQWM